MHSVYVCLHTRECCSSISKTSSCLFHNCLARTVVPFSCPSQEIAMSSGHLISILRTYFKIQAHFSGSLLRKLSVCNTRVLHLHVHYMPLSRKVHLLCSFYHRHLLWCKSDHSCGQHSIPSLVAWGAMAGK